jgi:nucleosome binding factor SPN SPT16 subunit
MEDIQAYTNEKQFPKDLKPGLIYVDKVHNTVLVPYNAQGVFVPFHVSTIKTVSTKTEGQWTFLRLNFHIPAIPHIFLDYIRLKHKLILFNFSPKPA